jgi:hypothetical protein
MATAFVFVLLCGARSYSQVQPPDEHASDTISGTVVNSVTHEPIGRALVYSVDGRYATFTDDHGHFELSLPNSPQGPSRMAANGQAVLQVKKPGFLSDPGPRGSANVGHGEKEVTLSLVPEALIIGQVKFPSAEAADHAELQLYRRARFRHCGYHSAPRR